MSRVSGFRLAFAALATGSVCLLAQVAGDAVPPLRDGFPPAELRTQDYLYRYEDDAATGLRITITDLRRHQLRFLEQVPVQPGCKGSQFPSGLTSFPVRLEMNHRPRTLDLVVACGMDEGQSQTLWIFSGFERLGQLGFDESAPNLTLVGSAREAVLKADVYTRRSNDEGVPGVFLEVYELSPFGSPTGSFRLAFDATTRADYRGYYESFAHSAKGTQMNLEQVTAALIGTQDAAFICAQLQTGPLLASASRQQLQRAIDFDVRFGFPSFDVTHCRE
jgi:hypothetical protein